MDNNTVLGVVASLVVVAVGGAISFAMITTGDTAAIEEGQERMINCARRVIDNQDGRMGRLEERIKRLEMFHFGVGSGGPNPAPIPATHQQDIERIRASLFFPPTSWIQQLYPDRTIFFQGMALCNQVLCGMNGHCPFLGTKG